MSSNFAKVFSKALQVTVEGAHGVHRGRSRFLGDKQLQRLAIKIKGVLLIRPLPHKVDRDRTLFPYEVQRNIGWCPFVELTGLVSAASVRISSTCLFRWNTNPRSNGGYPKVRPFDGKTSTQHLQNCSCHLWYFTTTQQMFKYSKHQCCLLSHQHQQHAQGAWHHSRR